MFSYENGAVKVWEIATGTLVLTLNGHRAAVTSLSYNGGGTLLVSGARDTEIIGTCGDTAATQRFFRIQCDSYNSM